MGCVHLSFSGQTQGRFLTQPDMVDEFEKEMAEKEAAEKEAAEKEAEKAAQEAARTSRIQADTVSRQFTGSLSSYKKKKEDLIILASALALPTSGTVPQLYAAIKSHLDTHPELATNGRFAGLFNSRHRNAAAECSGAGESAGETTAT